MKRKDFHNQDSKQNKWYLTANFKRLLFFAVAVFSLFCVRLVSRVTKVTTKYASIIIPVFLIVSIVAVYAAVVDRTVYVGEKMLLLPGNVQSSSWQKAENSVAQDLGESSLFQSFSDDNSASLRELVAPPPPVIVDSPSPSPDPSSVEIEAGDAVDSSEPSVEYQDQGSVDQVAPEESFSEPVLEEVSRAYSELYRVANASVGTYPYAQVDITQESVIDSLPPAEDVILNSEQNSEGGGEAIVDEVPSDVVLPIEVQQEAIITEETESSPSESIPSALNECLTVADCETYSLVYSDFLVPEFESGTMLDNAQIRLSLSAKTKSLSNIQRFLVEYSYDEGQVWQTASVIDVESEIANSINGGYFLVSLPEAPTPLQLANLSLRISYQGDITKLEGAYVDAVWLEINSGKFFEEGDFVPPTDTIDYSRSLEAPKFHELDANGVDENVNTLPSFTLRYSPQQNFFRRIFTALFSENQYSVEQVRLTDVNGEATEIPIEVIYHDDTTWTVQFKKQPQKFVAGKYTVEVIVNENDVLFTDSFQFYWGVLAVNTTKSRYFPNEEVQLQLAALTDQGDTICNANLALKIIDPKNTIYEVPVEQTDACGPNNVTDRPDYIADFVDTGEWGLYTIQLEHLNYDGEVVHRIEDSFEVAPYIPFDIERTAPTRIFPPAPYDVSITVTAYRDFIGDINEKVPRGFIVEGLEGAVISTLPEYTLITWKDVALKEGEKITLNYKFDAPDISPYLYLLGPLDMDGFSELRQWQIASDALNNIGWFEGTRTIAGTNLNSATESPLQWSTSSIDNYYFAHATSTNSHQVTLRQDGDYFISVTVPHERTDTNNTRVRIGVEVKVNGVTVPEGVSRSGYSLGSPVNAHTESSTHVNFLLTGVSAGDVVEVFTRDLTTHSISDTAVVSGQAAMYIEYIPPATPVFAAIATSTVASTSLNTAASALRWIETRQDSGFVHSNSINAQNIIISNPGTYRVYVNIPYDTSVRDTNILGRVLLDGAQVTGGSFSQGYLLGSASENDNFASIHWSGVVTATTTNQILTITTEQEAAASTAVVPGGFAASVYIEAVPSDDTIVLQGTTLTGGTPNDWSPAAQESVLWTNRSVYDAVTFTHSTSSDPSGITVNEGGDYLLTYTDALTTAGGGTNPRITVEVNGVPVVGAQTKTHIIRNVGGQNNSSGALVYLIEGISAGQVVRVRVQEEATNQTVDDSAPAILTLTKKISLNERAVAPSMFNVPFDNVRLASTTPAFEFQSSDPDGSSDIQYEFAISTSPDFASATIRTSGVDAGFSNTASSTDTSPFVESNRIRFQLQPADALTDLITYYWRVRAKDVSGSGGFGDWSTTQSLTVNLAAVVPNWYQSFTGQFNSNNLVGTVSAGDDRVQVDAGVNSEILIAYGDGTNTTPRYRLWDGTSWGTQLNALPVGGTINWVRTAAGVTRDEYVLVTLDQSSAAYAQVYNSTSSTWSNQVLLSSTVNNVTRRGVAVGYESLSGDAMAVSCGSGPSPVYRIWNGSTWSATSSISVSSLNNCSFLEIASDPASDEMILVVRDSGASVGSNYEALVWDGTAWIANRVIGSVQAGQEGRVGIGLAYEASGQQAIIAVTNGTNPNIAYTTWNGTSFTTNATQPIGNDFEFGKLAADADSDDMALCYVDEDTDAGVLLWNGGSWQTFQEIDLTPNSNTGRPIDCEFETVAGRSDNLLITYSDTVNARYQVYSGSWPVVEQTVTGIEDSFWVQTAQAGDGTIVMVTHDDVAAGDEIESSYFNGTNWSVKQSVVPNPSSVIATPYETFEMAAKRFQFTQGVVTTKPISFSFVPGRPTWGDLSFSTTEPFGTDVRVKLRYTSTTTCDAYIPNGALPGNADGFDVASSTVNISGLSTTTYNQICLEATITTLGSESASLDDWSLTWQREPKLIQNNYRWYNNGSFLTPTDPWPFGVTDLLENTPMGASEAVNINDVVRLRMSLQGSNIDLATSSRAFKLQYAPGEICTPLLPWTDVAGPASSTAVWRGFENAIVGSDWLNAAWKNRLKITVEGTLVNGAQTDFPVYVNLDDLPDSFFAKVQSDGDDIRITNSTGITELPYELVWIDTVTRRGELHFKANLASTTDTEFFIYYGNPSASGYAPTATFGRNNVWTNGYEAVYHLQTSPTGNLTDSTSNGRTLTTNGGMTAAQSTSSVMGQGIDFDGLNDRLTNSGWSWTAAPVTVTAWNNVATAEVQNSNLFGFTAVGNERLASHAPWVDNTIYWDYGTCCTAPGRLSTNYTTYRNKWTHIGLVSQGTPGAFMGIYLDGSLITSAGTSDDPNVTLTGFSLGSDNPSGGNHHNGRIDEFRIASVARSAGWIRTERTNQSNPTGFYAVSAEELIGDGSPLPSTMLTGSDYAETYEEQNPTLTNRNAIIVGNDAEWDFVLQNNGGLPDTEYCFRMVYEDGSTFDTYTRYPQIITNSPPPPPVLVSPFDNEQFASSTPWFEFFTDDALSDDVSYEIQIDNNYDFNSVTIGRESNANFALFTNLAAPSQRGIYTTGNTIQFIPNASLSNGTYYWRVRARDDNGSGAYGDWSTPASFTIASTSITTWFQTTGEQFNSNNLLDAEVSTTSNDVGILTGFTSATTTSTAIDYDDRETGNAWGQFSFTHNVTSGSIRYFIEYNTGGDVWALIPDTDLPGNAAGFTSSPVSLIGLNTITYNEIRLTAVLSGNPTLPRLLDWKVEWGETIEIPDIIQPFDNAKVNSLLPTFTFFTTDPQSNDLQYEVQIATEYTFSSPTTVVSGVDNGFLNVTNGADTSPFTSGDTVSYTAQSPLTNNTTYWWRVRAKDPGGADIWSEFNEPISFTVDTAAVTATWFQTTGEQFATDDLINIETVSGGAQVTSVVSEVMSVYGEGSGQSPQYRVWNGASWSAPESAESVDAQIRWTQVKANPTRPEYVLGTLGTDLDINFQVYDGVTQSWGNVFEIYTESVEATKRRFDLAFETNSGDLIAVACAGTDALYSVWDGVVWSATSTIDLANANNCEWVQLTADPNSNEIIALFRHTNTSATDYQALVWNGSSWGNSTTFGDISNNTFEGMAVNYEYSGGQALVVASNNANNSFLWSAWNGSSWTTATATAVGNDFWWATLSRDEGTDNMALCYIDGDNDIGVLLWNGSGWNTFSEIDQNNNDINGPGVDCEFETLSGRDGNLLISYSDGVLSRYQVYTYASSSFSVEADLSTMNDGFYMQSVRGSDGIIHTYTLDDASAPDRYDTSRWNGTVWSPLTNFSTNPSITASPYNGSITMAARLVSNFTEGSIRSTPITFSSGNSPRWERVRFNDTTPGASDIRYRVYYETATGTYALVPDTALSGNLAGFTNSPISIASLDREIYDTLKLEAEFTCSSGNCPSIQDWSVEWSQGITVSGTAFEYDQLTAVSTGTIAVAVNGVLQVGKIDTLETGTTTQQVVFDIAGTSTFTVPEGVSNVTVKAWGAGGGAGGGGTSDAGGAGGGAGFVQANISVIPTEDLSIFVGGGGIGGSLGLPPGAGGGGGYSGVFRTSTPLLVAGGGGGGGAGIGGIRYVGVGTACAGSATTCTPGIPASTQSDDVYIAVLHSRASTTHTCTTNCSGWNEIPTQAGSTAEGRLSVWWYRQSGAAPANPTFGGPATTDSYTGRIWAYRGVATTGNPYDVVGTNVGIAATTTFSGNNLNSTVADAMVIHVAGSMDDNTWGPSSGSCTVPNSVNANFYANTLAGGDNSVALCYRENPLGAAGPLGVPTITQAGNSPDAGRYFTFALRPNASGIMAAGSGGVGGGVNGGAGGNASTTIGGGGGTQSTGGTAGGGSATVGSAYMGGNGNSGTGGGTGGAGGFTGGGAGGTGNLSTIAAAGGGGGAGYFGGGGAHSASGAYIAGAGGGGGSSFIEAGATATTTQSGSGVSAGNNSDIDYVAGVGAGNTSATSSNGGNGGDGRVVISWSTGNVPGAWSIPNVSAFPGDVITVFMQNASGTAEAVAVTKYDGTGDISGMELSKRHLTLGSNDNGIISNADIGQYQNIDDEDLFYSVTGGNVLDICVESDCLDVRLNILAGTTYRPDANGEIINFQNDGIFEPQTNTLRVSGDWGEFGTFTPAASTIIFTATTGSTTLLTSTSTYEFNNVTFGETSGSATWNITKPLDIEGTLAVNFGTLNRGTSTIAIAGNFTIGASGALSGIATTTFDGIGNSVWSDAKASSSSSNAGFVVIDGTSKSITLGGNVGAETITIGSNDSLNSSGSGFNINVLRGWTNNNIFVPQNGTVTFLGTTTGTINQGASPFNNLSFAGVGGNWAFSTSTLALNGTFLIATGTVTLPTGTTTIAGSFLNTGGTFLHNNGEVRMTSSVAGRTITQRGTQFLNAFYDLVFTGSGSWSFSESAATTTRNLRITAGTVTSASGTLTIGGDFLVTGSGVFAHNNGEVILLVQDADELRMNGSSLNNLRTMGSGTGSWYNPSWTKRVRVTVNSSQVPATLTDFPVYVNLANLPDAFFSGVKADGGDIRMTTSDGISEVPVEIVSINTTTKTGELHFRAPTLSSTTNSVFYVYYGNSSAATNTATSTFGRANVWSNGYEAVYHLGTNPAGTTLDSTRFGRNLVSAGGMVAGNSVAGVLGNAVDFEEGTNDYLRNTTFAWANATNTVTVTAWNNVATSEVRNANLFGFVESGGERFASHAPFGGPVIYWDFGTCCNVGTSRVQTSYTPYLDKWTHIAMVSTGATGAFMGLYLDGTLITSSTGAIEDPNATLTGFGLGALSSSGGGLHNGRIDEFRIASVVRSGSWITAERNNQASSTAFYSVAAEELRQVRTFADTNTTILGNFVLDTGGDAVFPVGTLSIGGSFDNNASFSANNGTVRFNSTAGAETIAVGTSSNFATLEFNGVGGDFTVTESATATVAINVAQASQFTLQSGRTLAALGTFTNAASSTNTTWTGSILLLTNGSSTTLNAKTHGGDTYGTLRAASSTLVRMWNSSADAYEIVGTTSAIYSQDHAGVDGDLNIYGNYVRTTGTEFWSFATDFDGAALTASTSRQVDVRVASSSSVGFTGASLNLVGTSSASTTINAIAGSFGISATSTTITAEHFTMAGMDAAGLALRASTTLSTFRDGFFTVVPGRTGITMSSTTVANNPSAQFFRIGFATTTAGAGSNVTLVGTTTQFVWFRTGAGNLYGEAFDAGDANPGSIRFDDSSNSIVVSGVVYSNDGTTPLGAPTCDGVTQNVRIVVDGGTYSSSTSCAVGTGAYSFPAVNYIGDPKVIVYLNTNGGVQGSVVTKTPTANITNMHIYANRVITRHQDIAPLTVADMTLFDIDNDTDVRFNAASTSLTLMPGTELFVFSTTTFAPGVNVSILGNAGTTSFDGTLQIGNNATFTANGTETHTLGGRFVARSGAVFTPASSTVVFNATTSGKSITASSSVTFNNLQFAGAGGSWNIGANMTVLGDMAVNSGIVTGTGNITLPFGSITGNGTLSLGQGTTTIARTNTLGGNTPWTFFNLQLGDGSQVGTTTPLFIATTTVAGRLTIAQGHFLAAGATAWDLSGTGTVFIENGTFLEDTSTVRYSGAGANVLSTTYHNLDINAGAGSQTYTATGLGIIVSNNLTIGGQSGTTFDINTSDPALDVNGSLTIRSNGTMSASNSGALTIAGNYVNSGVFTSNNGTTTFDGTATAIINPGSSSLGNVIVNKTGQITVSENATTTGTFTIQNATTFTLASGKTLTVNGPFFNGLGGSATTWSGSTLRLSGNGNYTANASTTADSYDTLAIDGTTQVRLWNSEAATYVVASGASLYSQDHAGTNGLLTIWGDYRNTGLADYWAYAVDFDGTPLSGGARKVDVRLAPGASAAITGGSLLVQGTSTASTSIESQAGGSYGFTIGGTASTSWQFYEVRDINSSGLTFSGTPNVTTLSNGSLAVSQNGGSAMTVNASVITANPARNFTQNEFFLDGVASGFNVTASGTTVSAWRFTNHYGDIDGESFDVDPGGDPGYISWDDSAALITVSGIVYSDEGATVSTVCDGSTNNITLRVAGITTYSTSCNATTGAYSISNVAYGASDSLVVYIDGATPKGATVTNRPISNISDLHIYENRVIVRHENSNPITIDDMAAWDSADDSDIPFTAVNGTPDTLTLPADRKLIVWNGKTFAPGGDVVVSGNGGGAAFDGTLQLFTNAKWTGTGTEALSIGGSFVLDTGAEYTTGNGTTTFTTTGSGRTIDTNSFPLHNVSFTGSGSWSITDPVFTANGNVSLTSGSVSLPSATSTFNGSFVNSGGSFSANGGTARFLGTGAQTVRFGGSSFATITFAGGNYTITDSAATSTGSVTITSGGVTLPVDTFTVGRNFVNNGGAITHNTANLILTSTTTTELRASSSDLFAVTFAGGGSYTMSDSGATLLDNLTITNGSAVRLASGTLAVGGSFDASGGTFTNATTTVLFNAPTTGKTINPGTSSFYGVQIAAPSGGYTLVGNATTTHNFTLASAQSFTVQSGVTVRVGGVFTNTTNGANTNWSGSTLVLDSGSAYTINTKSTGGDRYGTLSIGANSAIRSWNSSATTTIVAASGSLYSQDHNATDGLLAIYGNFQVGTTTEYWSYATDFDGASLSGVERAVAVIHAQNATTTVNGGSLQIIGNSGSETLITNQGTGTYAFTVSAGTLNAQRYTFRNLNATGLNLIGSPTITSLSFGDFELAVSNGSLITVASSTLNANASKLFTGNRFATTTAITGSNVTLVGETDNVWTFASYSGNLAGEAFDVDGVTQCGSLRWANSQCLITQQTHYRWRNDDGGLGVPSSEWYDEDWSSRKSVTIDNVDTTTYTDAAIQMIVPYDTGMRSDFKDLRFTATDGVTIIPHWFGAVSNSDQAEVWVQVPSLPASSLTTVYMYYNNATATSSASLTDTFISGDDFEAGSLSAYSGQTSLFGVTGALTFDGVNALNNLANTSGRSNLGGIFRLDQVVSQGEKFRFMKYVNTTAGSSDEACMKFGVQSPGSANNNYAVCVEQFGTDRISLVRNAVDNDSTGTMLASSSVTYATGWYEVEVAWGTDDTITVYLYNSAGTLVTSISATDGTYTSGGIGMSFWFHNGAWDSVSSRPLLTTEPEVYFGDAQVSGGASWRAAQNAPGTYITNDIARLRVAIENSGLEVTAQELRLEYAELGSAPTCEAVNPSIYAPVPSQASCTGSPVCMQDSTFITNGSSIANLLTNTRGVYVPGEVRENPTNITSAFDIGQGEYVEVEYAVTPTIDADDAAICLRVTDNGDAFDTYLSVAQLSLRFDPSITNISLNGGEDINLIPATTTRVFATGTVSDFNGYTDLVAATTTFYRSGVAGGADCTPDNNNCYVSTLDNTCSFVDCSGSSCTLSCYADIVFHADPTDAGAFVGQEWFAFAEVSDTADGYDFETSIGQQLNTLRAITVDGGINYGALEVNNDTGSFNPVTTVENQGNVAIDIEIVGTDMTDGASSAIPAEFQRFATSTFTYNSCVSCSQLSSSTPVVVDTILSKPITVAPPVANAIYWGIAIPFGTNSAPHTGVNVFTPISP